MVNCSHVGVKSWLTVKHKYHTVMLPLICTMSTTYMFTYTHNMYVHTHTHAPTSTPTLSHIQHPTPPPRASLVHHMNCIERVVSFNHSLVCLTSDCLLLPYTCMKHHTCTLVHTYTRTHAHTQTISLQFMRQSPPQCHPPQGQRQRTQQLQ